MIDIDIAQALKNEGIVYRYRYQAVPDFGSDIAFASPLRLDLEYCVVDKNQISVKGTVQTVLKQSCDRCLEVVLYPFQSEFQELFAKNGSEDEDQYSYNGEILSLDKMIYDLILLERPQRFLCRDDCKGLCPKCGQNLNEKQCDCKLDDADETNPFAKLKGLF